MPPSPSVRGADPKPPIIIIIIIIMIECCYCYYHAYYDDHYYYYYYFSMTSSDLDRKVLEALLPDTAADGGLGDPIPRRDPHAVIYRSMHYAPLDNFGTAVQRSLHQVAKFD